MPLNPDTFEVSMRWQSLALGCCLAGLLAVPAAAIEFDLPKNAVQTALREEVATLQPLPRGVFTGSDTQFLAAEGRVVHAAYTISATSLTPFQLIAPLKAQLEADGYQSIFACADTVCGGFDFRYLLDVLPEPHMHVDLGNFQYLLATNQSGGVVALVTSRARTAGFVHITQITPDNSSIVVAASASTKESTDTTVTTVVRGHLAQTLTQNGSVPLDDLAFETGSSTLAEGRYKTLAALANFLLTSEARVTLVGHTDAEGGLDSNIALSRKRAASVRDRLIATYGVAASQVAAEGVGYLAPRASNATPQGRETNRRVEAILTSTP
jgi:outer membrane protein OmpA-like peptidoglycan-associated protein